MTPPIRSVFRRARIAGAVLAVLVAAVALGGCLPDGPAQGSELRVVVADPVTSLNPESRAGRDEANASVLAPTRATFFRFDGQSQLQADTEVGTAEASVPAGGGGAMSVTYTIAEGLAWSDGVPVDAADLLLAWAAGSGALNTPGASRDQLIDAATGAALEGFGPDVVYFDARSGDGLDHVPSVPAVGADGVSVTLEYDVVFPDWRLVFEPGLAAHQVASMALGVEDPEQAKQAVIAAVQGGDPAALAALSRVWSTGFSVAADPATTPLPLSAGPYMVTALTAGGVELALNPEYAGTRVPPVETVRVSANADPASALAALEAGDADVVVPRSTQEALDAASGAEGIVRVAGYGPLSEHLDLQFANGASGAFDSPVVREAFLLSLPRPEIVERIVTPFDDDAAPLDSFVAAPPQPVYAALVAGNGSARYGEPDPSAAAALLASAGAGSPSVCIMYDPANARRVLAFQLIQEAAAAAGFAVTDCSRGDWLDYLGVAGAYDAALYAWTATPAVEAPRSRYHSTDSITNVNWYANPGVDSAIADLSAATVGAGALGGEDAAVVEGALARIDSALWADAFGAPLYQQPAVAFAREGIDGIVLSPFEPGVLWNLTDWTIAG